MIQFRRGTTKSWRNTKTKLASGQPGYDKDKHKIKIGDGSSDWEKLPYASGLSAEEILDSEKNAKSKVTADTENKTIITYGTEAPDKNTVGQLYLQQYDSEPEADYVVKSGVDGNWTYQKWKSGIATCWCTIKLSTSIQNTFDDIELFYDNKVQSIKYPFAFKEVPSEVATLQSPGWIVWLANKSKNTKNTSGVYTIVSPDKQSTNADYIISLQVEGLWR
jgi:uncharacterized protein YktA (UPF0223 family)